MKDIELKEKLEELIVLYGSASSQQELKEKQESEADRLKGEYEAKIRRLNEEMTELRKQNAELMKTAVRPETDAEKTSAAYGATLKTGDGTTLQEDTELMGREIGKMAAKALVMQAGGLEAIERIEAMQKLTLDKIIETYERILSDEKANFESVYVSAEGIKTDSEVVLKFVSGLKKYEKKERFKSTGLFLSGLINNLPENEELVLDLSTFAEEPLSHVGYKLSSRNLVIRGNVGGYLGDSMYSGEIILKGNAGDFVGDGMRNGKITVEGNCGDYLGNEMKNGEIIVKGSAGDYAGNDMENGSITIKGNAGNKLGDGMIKGKILLEGNALDDAGYGVKGGEVVVKKNAKNEAGSCMGGGTVTIEGNVGNEAGNMMNGGMLVIKGNTGKELGNCMRGGQIIVEGNAEDHVGWLMDGGEITVKGDVGDDLGDGMENGKIKVYGDAGKDVGGTLRGGEIRLEGDYKSVSSLLPDFNERGRVYHRGRILASPGNTKSFFDEISEQKKPPKKGFLGGLFS